MLHFNGGVCVCVCARGGVDMDTRMGKKVAITILSFFRIAYIYATHDDMHQFAHRTVNCIFIAGLFRYNGSDLAIYVWNIPCADLFFTRDYIHTSFIRPRKIARMIV